MTPAPLCLGDFVLNVYQPKIHTPQKSALPDENKIKNNIGKLFGIQSGRFAS
jgi:hypothetical protein